MGTVRSKFTLEFKQTIVEELLSRTRFLEEVRRKESSLPLTAPNNFQSEGSVVL